jgi:hypothetical protein
MTGALPTTEGPSRGPSPQSLVGGSSTTGSKSQESGSDVSKNSLGSKGSKGSHDREEGQRQGQPPAKMQMRERSPVKGKSS